MVQAFKPKGTIPAVLTITDIAGLVKGAAEGAGLGNAFLSHIQAVDGIYHMVRAFSGEEVTHVEGNVDPIRDLEIIHKELLLKDIANVSNRVDATRKNVERGMGGKEAKQEFDVLVKALALMQDEGKDIRLGEWSGLEIEYLNRHNLITSKPMIYLVNLSARDYIRKRNKFLEPLAEWLKNRNSGDKMIPISCEFEQKIFDMNAEEKDAFCKENNARSVMPRVLRTGYHNLNLIHFFTAGMYLLRFCIWLYVFHLPKCLMELFPL